MPRSKKSAPQPESADRPGSTPVASTQAQLYRSETNRMIAGVCGGLGDYFSIDPVVIRLVFIALAVFGGSGILLYLILWLIIPSRSQTDRPSHDTVKNNADEMKMRAQELAGSVRANPDNSRLVFGVIVLIFGIMFLLNNFGITAYLDIGRLWPVFLILIGLSILTRNGRRTSK